MPWHLHHRSSSTLSTAQVLGCWSPEGDECQVCGGSPAVLKNHSRQQRPSWAPGVRLQPQARRRCFKRCVAFILTSTKWKILITWFFSGGIRPLDKQPIKVSVIGGGDLGMASVMSILSKVITAAIERFYDSSALTEEPAFRVFLCRSAVSRGEARFHRRCWKLHQRRQHGSGDFQRAEGGGI